MPLCCSGPEEWRCRHAVVEETRGAPPSRCGGQEERRGVVAAPTVERRWGGRVVGAHEAASAGFVGTSWPPHHHTSWTPALMALRHYHRRPEMRRKGATGELRCSTGERQGSNGSIGGDQGGGGSSRIVGTERQGS
jgi:hypothetical protein